MSYYGTIQTKQTTAFGFHHTSDKRQQATLGVSLSTVHGNSFKIASNISELTMSIIGKYDLLTHEELFDAIENDLTNSNFKTSAIFLMSALTDWPTSNLQEPRDLILELRSKIKGKLNFDNLEGYLKNLNPGKDAWKMEALAALLQMFDFERNNSINKTIELEMLIARLTQHYK